MFCSSATPHRIRVAAPFAQRDHWVFGQMSRAALELSAMLLAASQPADATAPATALG